MPRGYDRPLYILPFDHRGSFQTKMFGWQSPLSDAQTAEIAGAKRVIYDGFLYALAGGVPREKASVLVDEQFGASILHDAPRLMVEAIEELQHSGVDPDLWKVEGLVRREDCERVVAAARAGGRHNVGCIVLGGSRQLCRGSSDLQSAARFFGIRWSPGGENERRALRPLPRSAGAIVNLWICSSGKMQAYLPSPRRA
jgi:myo-inositol catabolism protein IolC